MAGPPSRRLPGRPVVLAALGVIVGVTWAATWLDDGSGSGGGGAANLEHVHGVGVDPVDGAVHAGSHDGLYRATQSGGLDGPIADRVQDFMGFTVLGPNRHRLRLQQPDGGVHGQLGA